MRRLVAITVALAWSGPAVAQPRAALPNPPGAFLNTSFEAQEKLDAALRQADAGRYATAAAALGELVRRSGDYLVAGDAGVHVTIRRHANLAMCGWPADGRAIMEQTLGPPAQERLSRARRSGSIGELLLVADDAFATVAGAQALDEAAERALAAGDLWAARRWWSDLESRHPSRTASGVRWRAKAACAAAWSGDRSALTRLLSELAATGGPTVNWAGREQLLRDFLRDVERDVSGAGPAEADAFDGSPSVFAGGAARRSASRTTARAEARLWRSSEGGLSQIEHGFEGYESSVARRDAMMRAVQSGRLLSAVAAVGDVVPAGNGGATRTDDADAPRTGTAGRRLVFLHDATSAWAIDPEDPGAEVWRYRLADSSPDAATWSAEEDTPALYTCLFNNGRLYLNLERRGAADGDEREASATSLVCLDAATGRLIWRNDLDKLAGEFEQLRIDGAPLLADGRLMAVARRRKAFGFEACYLLGLRASDGTLETTTHLAEAATGSYGYHRATLTHPAAQGDLVFVATNLGAVAAVSRHTGRVEWLATYASQYSEAPEGLWPTRMGRPARSWHHQPAMVWGDAVVASPLDAEHVLVLDAVGGRERFRISLESLHLPEVVLGLAGNRLYVAGTVVVCYDLAARRIEWQRPLEHGQAFGRGAVTSAGLLIPTERALVTMSLDGGPPSAYRWNIEDAGNVTVLADQIVTASLSGASGLVSREVAFERIATRMRERPADPRPALAMAELALSDGQPSEAVSAMREAIRRMGGVAGVKDEAARRRLFGQLMAFASGSMRGPAGGEGGPGKERVEAAVAFLELAGACTAEAAEKASVELRLAQARRRLGDAAGAVAAYQRILSDAGLRAARLEIDVSLLPPARAEEPVSEAEVARQPAGYVAAICIDRLIHETGRGVYQSIEQQAALRLAEAEHAGEAAGLLDVSRTYPNSDAATKALGAYGRLAAQRKDWQAASDGFRRSLRRCAAAERPAIMVELIDTLVAGGQPGLAGQWLARAVRDHPDYSFEHGGRRTTLLEYGRRVIGERPPREPAHDVAVEPARSVHRMLFNDYVSVLEPVFSRLPRTRWDTIVTYSDGRIEARTASTGRPLWPQPVAAAVQPTLLGMDGERYVFSTPYRLFALARDSGRQVWSVGDEPAAGPQGDPEEVASLAAHAMTPTRVYSATDRGELWAVDLADGAIRWRVEARLPIGGQLAAGERYVCHTLWQDQAQSIVVLDAATGRAVHTLRLGDDWPIQTIVFTSTNRLIAVVSNSVTAFDLSDGSTLWTLDSEERFVMASMQLDEEGLMISCDSRRITKYDLHDGQPIWTSAPLAKGHIDGLWAEASDGRLLVAASDQVTALDTADGRTLWARTVPGLMRMEPPRVARDCLVALVEASAEEAAAERAWMKEWIDSGDAAAEASALLEATRESAATSQPAASGPPDGQSALRDWAERHRPLGGRERFVRIIAFDLESGAPWPLRAGPAQGGPSSAAANTATGDVPAGLSIISGPMTAPGGFYVRDGALVLLDGRRMICYVGGEE